MRQQPRADAADLHAWGAATALCRQKAIVQTSVTDHPSHVVRLAGDLDIATIPDVTAVFAAVPPGGELVVDLTDVGVLSAAAIGVLVREARGRRGGVRVRNPSAMHCKVLEITSTDWLVERGKP